MELLHSKILGEGQPLLILHGFLGMSDNWKTLGNKFAEQFEVHLIDQRNHGRSFHDSVFSYEILAQDLAYYVSHYNLENIILLGHSMGGKTAMQFALSYPNLIDKLIVADIAPKVYPAHHQYILKALSEVDFSKHTSRKEIETVLQQYIPEIGVVQFLMKNVYRRERTILDFRFNLPVLIAKYEEVVKTFDLNTPFSKPTLFLKGSKSKYINSSDIIEINRWFQNAEVQDVSEAGHWLHADNPVEFYQKVIDFC